jgi:hypothetical protein
MVKRKIDDLLRALAAHGIERARPELGQEIKARIPSRLAHRPMDTFNIIVDLRISRVAAAAVILLAMFLLGSFLGGRDAAGTKMYEDGKMLLHYLGGEDAAKAEFLGNLVQLRNDLAAQGREVVYYGDPANLKDPCAILMHWKLSDDKYAVILGDLTARTVSAKTLITLQGHMLQKRTK